MESTETLSVKVKDLLIRDGLVGGFRKISDEKSLRIGFARLLVCIGFLEGKNYCLFERFYKLYPCAAGLVIFHLLDPSVINQNGKISTELKEKLTLSLGEECSWVSEGDVKSELLETLDRFKAYLRSWKLKAVIDRKTVYPRKDVDEDLFVIAQTAAKFVLTKDGNMSEYIKFLQCRTLQTLTGNVFTYEEQFKFGLAAVDSKCLSEDVVVSNSSLLTVVELHEIITSGRVKDEENLKKIATILEDRVLNGPLEEARKIPLPSADKILHDGDPIPDYLFKVPIAAIFRKNSNDIIDEFGIKLAALSPKRTFNFVTNAIMTSKISLLRLALFLPESLYSAFTQFIYESFEERFERRTESAVEKNCIIKLVEFLPLIYKDNQKGLLHTFDELSELIEFFDNQWFWEIVASHTKKIEYSEFERLGGVILDIHESICRDFMNFPYGVRSLSSSLCSKVTDSTESISIDDLFWLTTCSLPRTCLPRGVFALCSNESVNNLYPVEFETSGLPISCLLSAVAFGADLKLEPSLTDDENVKSIFSMAVSTALVQLLPVLEKNEAKRVGLFLSRYSSHIICPPVYESGEVGLTGLISVISLALELLQKKEVSSWMNSMLEENLQRNIHQLLMPIVNVLKRTEDLTVFNALLKLCSDHQIKELALPLSSTASGWKEDEIKNEALELLSASFPEIEPVNSPEAQLFRPEHIPASTIQENVPVQIEA